MYNDIGGKIKILAKVIFIVGMMASIIIGFTICFTSDDMLIIVGLLVMVVGSIVAWISSLCLYGFGQLIENSDIIAAEYNRKEEAHQKKCSKE